MLLETQLEKSRRLLEVKLSPKYNRGFFCECIRVKPSYKSIITMKEALLRFTVFSVKFSGRDFSSF